MKTLSFVIPCYRSEHTITLVVDEIRATVKAHPDYDYEIILVNDSSPDNVWLVIKKLAENDSKIKGICLAKNFGQHSALMAGYAQATGELVISLDDDGQTPASETFKLVDKINEGYDVVYGYFAHGHKHILRRLGTFINKKMAEALIDQPRPLQTTSFFIAKKYIINEIVHYKNPYPYISGLIFRTTKKLGNIEVTHKSRIEGQSGYTIAKLFSLWVNGFTAFSIKPLRIATLAGLFCAAAGLLGALYIIVQKFFHPNILIGYTSIMAAMLIIGGMIMFILGLIGEYVGRIYISLNAAPQYIIRGKVNL